MAVQTERVNVLIRRFHVIDADDLIRALEKRAIEMAPDGVRLHRQCGDMFGGMMFVSWYYWAR